TMADDGRGSLQHHARIDAPLAHLIFPNRLPRLQLEGMNRPVTAAVNKQTHSINDCYNRRSIGGVERPSTWRAYPDGFACLFVERHKALASARLVSPAGRKCADNDQLSFHYRGDGAPAVGGDDSKVLCQGAFPE